MARKKLVKELPYGGDTMFRLYDDGSLRTAFGGNEDPAASDVLDFSILNPPSGEVTIAPVWAPAVVVALVKGGTLLMVSPIYKTLS